MLPKIRADFDEEGVYFYQAFQPSIANYAIENQRFGGDDFKPVRMTWIKPSFAWVLYRSGYASKCNQERILKVKLPHAAVASLLAACHCPGGGLDSASPPASLRSVVQVDDMESDTQSPCAQRSAGSRGVVQWDPERDVRTCDPKNKKVPRKMLRQRSIQIGLQGGLSEFYVQSALSIEDVTEQARAVGRAHQQKKSADCEAAMQALLQEGALPNERLYEARLLQERHKLRLGLLPGEAADRITQLGRGGVPNPK